MIYTKKDLNQFINKPVMLSYFWNDAKNSITGTIKKAHYKIVFKKLDSHDRITIRYNQIDSVELLELDINIKKL